MSVEGIATTRLLMNAPLMSSPWTVWVEPSADVIT